MMIRGRHRGLPYQLDRAIMLPGRADGEEEEREIEDGERVVGETAKMKRFHTR